MKLFNLPCPHHETYCPIVKLFEMIYDILLSISGLVCHGYTIRYRESRSIDRTLQLHIMRSPGMAALSDVI